MLDCFQGKKEVPHYSVAMSVLLLGTVQIVMWEVITATTELHMFVPGKHKLESCCQNGSAHQTDAVYSFYCC